MTKGQKIGLIVGLLVIAGGAGAYFYFKEKKKEEEDSPANPLDQGGSASDKKGMSNDEIKSNPVIKKLNSDLGKVRYAMEIMENRKGTVYNKNTGKPVAEQLQYATWIQLKKRKNELKNDLLSTGANSQIKSYGEYLVELVNQDIDDIFNSRDFNTDQAWYKDYIKKYPEGIKGQA